jgi:hypothetical protein
MALERACRHQLRAEQVESDPEASLDDVVRFANMARRSYGEWRRIASARRAKGRRIPSLTELLGHVQA